MLQKFIRQPGMPVDSAIRVYRRYLKLEPTHAEEYIAYLKVKVSEAHGVGHVRHMQAGHMGAHWG